MDLKGVFAEGHEYTALSRFKSLDNLQVINFSGKVRPPNSLVKSFYEDLEKIVEYEVGLNGSNCCCRIGIEELSIKIDLLQSSPNEVPGSQ